MALIVADRKVARDICCAQLRGNSSKATWQHWWHPPSGRGVRTRISDDLLSVFPLAQEKHDLSAFAGAQFNRGL